MNTKNFIDAKSSALADLYSPADRQKIDEVNGVVRPLIERLVQAIRDKGIGQTDLLAIYPAYFDYHRIKNELSRMVFYAPNSERIQELQLKLAIKRNELDRTDKHTTCDLYRLFQPLLASSHYVLMTSIVAKCLIVAFQSEFANEQKKKEDLLRKVSAITQGQKDNSADQNKSNTTDNGDQKALADFNEIIDKKRILLDVIWRELTLLFNQRPNDHKLFGDKFTELLFKGQPFEILDGDNFRFNDKFLKAVFEVQKQQQLRIRVISVLGPQNSGKSTLLNFMFGCDFSVSDGRCTRGIYGSFIKATGESAIEFDYLLVLDTEGLQSIEKGDREYNRKLILFAFAVSNIVILNTKDQITEDFRATLEICVDSLCEIEMARVHRPTVYFVMNQKADPSKRNDQDAINKIIDHFEANGLITHLRLNDTNFETLPSAFNSHTIEINRYHELRYCTTAQDFTKRVSAFVKTIIDKARLTEKDEAFSTIIKWIEFSYLIFDTISNFPDLTFFNTIAERKQQRKCQEFINQNLTSKLSNVAKDALFVEVNKKREANENDADIEKSFLDIKTEFMINTFFLDIKQQLMKDFDDYIKQHVVTADIKRLQQEFLLSQIYEIKEWWRNELCIQIGESSLRREIITGEGRKLKRIDKLTLKSNFILPTGLTTKLNWPFLTNSVFDKC